ncbi:MYND-type domain-containing protein [Mycena chlorophos]|uniref:MYND-type domain-containing protein n=1 Tax=Mycena chlorophos TaxID=658473 RepID=A0A8H6VQI5_MYCCL|nr:MYND-type domain-containing protein [Mycena chlorophos]
MRRYALRCLEDILYQDILPAEAFVEMWARVWAWVQFLDEYHGYPGFLNLFGQKEWNPPIRLEPDVSALRDLVSDAFAPGILGVLGRVWVRLLRAKDDLGLYHISMIILMEQFGLQPDSRRLTELMMGTGGTWEHLAACAMGHIRRATVGKKESNPVSMDDCQMIYAVVSLSWTDGLDDGNSRDWIFIRALLNHRYLAQRETIAMRYLKLLYNARGPRSSFPSNAWPLPSITFNFTEVPGVIKIVSLGGDISGKSTWHDGSNNSEGTFTFQGAAVAIYGIDLDNPANITFTLDGQPAGYHYYDGTAQFVFNSLFYSAAGLALGVNHTVAWELHTTTKTKRQNIPAWQIGMPCHMPGDRHVMGGMWHATGMRVSASREATLRRRVECSRYGWMLSLSVLMRSVNGSYLTRRCRRRRRRARNSACIRSNKRQTRYVCLLLRSSPQMFGIDGACRFAAQPHKPISNSSILKPGRALMFLKYQFKQPCQTRPRMPDLHCWDLHPDFPRQK